MAARDLSPDRVTRARYALDDLLGAAHGARVALIAFSDEAYTVTPLTDDVATVRTLLPPLAPDIMPTPGDQLAPALAQAGKLLGRSEEHTSELQSLMRHPYAGFCLQKKNTNTLNTVCIEEQ